MDNFYQKGDNQIPTINLDAKTGVFEISGFSRPEDVARSYQPMLDWLEQYKKNPSEVTTFNFKFDYFNTASAKILYDILAVLDEIHLTGHEVNVNWYFEEPDLDMQGAGEEFNDMVEVDIKLISEKRS